VKDAIKLDILLVIAAAFGISEAMVNSGAAKLLADGVVSAAAPTGLVGMLSSKPRYAFQSYIYYMTLSMKA
jgi:di/tricarboxylate transporter